MMKLEQFSENVLIQRVIKTLKLGKRSQGTIKNYVHCINRFLIYFKNRNIEELNEFDIIEYLECNYLSKDCSANTYNLNICAIKYFYSVNFNKDFNSKLLPRAKISKRLPQTIDKDTFLKILNGENNLKYKCWLLLAYYSGLRASEIAQIKIEDINSKEHKLKVMGKRKKERYTFLADITIKFLRYYYKNEYYRNNIATKHTGYLFKSYNNEGHICGNSIVNYFVTLKSKYNLDNNLTFHSLRHSFASNFIQAGGEPFVLKSMMGHSSFNTTAIYIHMGRDFNNLKGIKYGNV